MANLSFEKIAGALAVIGTTLTVAACGGDVKPPEVPAVSATDAVPGAAAMDGGSCGAHKGGAASCSAKKDEVKAPETTAAAAPAAPAAPAATPDPKAAAGSAVAATPAPAGSAAPKKPDAKKAGSASCGAGTCAAKKK